MAGSRKGIPNRATSRTREAIAALLDNTAPQLAKWLEEVYKQEGPNEALKRVNDFLEFGIPKLARVEHTGENGGPVELSHRDVTAEVLKELPAEVLERLTKPDAT